MKTIYFAGGCFWGTEAYFKLFDGVVDTDVGYANGREDIKNPSYEQVCTNTTDFAETVKVVFDESKLSLEDLIRKFFKVINPTVINRQGPDIGSQYRTGIYYGSDGSQLEVRNTAKKIIEEEQKKYDKKIVTEVEPLKNYYSAEEYHQDYLDKNPGGYCHINLANFK